MFKDNFKGNGGSWLGAVRSWIQWHCIGGDSVTWGSNEVLVPPVTVKILEEAASESAWAAIKPFYDTKNGVREMVKLQIKEGKPVAKILEDMYEEMCKISEEYHVDEIPFSLPEAVTQEVESARKEIVEKCGDNIHDLAIYANICGRLWGVANKIKWKIH